MDGGLRVLDTEKCDVVVAGNNKTKGSKKGGGGNPPPRIRLADISNLQQPPSSKPSSNQQPFATKDYIEKLHQENLSLLKVLAERNKIIELTGIELQKLRLNLQKLQLQNLQLAQANTQMLAELNSGKDKLKALNHELGCKNSLLKARKLVLESRAKKVTSGNQVEADKSDKAGKIVEADDGDDKTCKTNRRRRQSKNRSSDSSTVKPIQDKENVDDRRLSLRRQSGRFKFEQAEPMEDRLPLRRQSARFKCEEPEPSKDRSEETEPVEDLFEIDDAKFPASPLRDAVVHESGPTLDASVHEEHEEGNGSLKMEAQECKRRSSGRPLRRAAEKIQSYKEIPLKVKMRRLE